MLPNILIQDRILQKIVYVALLPIILWQKNIQQFTTFSNSSKTFLVKSLIRYLQFSRKIKYYLIFYKKLLILKYKKFFNFKQKLYNF